MIMNEEHILYSICVEDVMTVSADEEIEFSEGDLDFIQDRIGRHIDWYGAIELALWDLKTKRKNEPE